jgi:hypothetical protein
VGAGDISGAASSIFVCAVSGVGLSAEGEEHGYATGCEDEDRGDAKQRVAEGEARGGQLAGALP